MLDALPPEEREFYRDEANVVDWTGKSRALFQEIEEKFAVGGSHEQYVRYFARSDLPEGMWNFTTAEHVEAVSGFSVVPKKNMVDQKKLLMMRSANYAWSSGKERSDYGLYGGGALSTIHVPNDVWSVAVSD